ncbi:right-handed parallel beta-helix repeat-containing protein [Sphingobacterium sp. PCS056]|uniref:right-handed parallel beta-helix repeat-containing protein n=1 Tax=Sphingobacterium sp. PCS056 TaxID=2931400 RepID=UPI00200D5F84|nr:right-handed parallel beta-helix repeat-containing protein [Sphingobacterium sp. PCS056]UPZ37851.1 right-handed parallel beta-helix repeat-containing protein [Sphingobacterium sp. PCS056]
MKHFIIIVYLFSLSLLSFAQQTEMRGGLKYYKIDKKYYPSAVEKSKFDTEIKQYSQTAFKVDNALPKGKKTKGQVDYTTEIQKLIDQYDVLLFPDYPLLINEKGLKVRSNQVLIFPPNSKLIMKANNKPRYVLLLIQEVQNVKIYNVKMEGDRYQHLNSEGEWGMGIRVFGAKNVKIVNPIIEKMWGDGIYIGGPRGKESKSVDVYNAVLDNNRRNAISITSADGVNIYNALCANSNGNLPKGGIDIEPNSNENVIDNIKLINPITFRNPVYGIALSLGKLVGEKRKTVNITIENPLIIGSKFGLTVPSFKAGFKKNQVVGTVTVNNLQVYYSSNPVKNVPEFEYDVNVVFNNFKFFNTKKGAGTIRNEKIERQVQTNLSKFQRINVK